MSGSDGKSSAEWAARWSLDASGPGRSGGQGTVRKVRNVTNGAFGALKVLHSHHANSSERRFRMRQEANALKAMDGKGVPKLLEFNEESSPYLVMEWIDGPTLSESVSGKPLPMDKALRLSEGLLETLERMHSLPVYHRDLKPDNIILRDASHSKPVIVDMGMAWAERDEDDHRTPDGQELGNRSLRLPEYAPGSAVGDDPRSDIAMLLGILFFALTGRLPRVLLDEQNRKPHQRPGSIPTIVESDVRWPKLRGVFTIGFEPGIANRFQTVAELKDRLQNLDPMSQSSTLADIEAAIIEIEDLKSSAAARKLQSDQLSLREGSQAFLREVQAITGKAGLNAGGSGPNFTGDGRSEEVNFFIVPHGASVPLVHFKHLAKAKGGKITMYSSAGGRTARLYHDGYIADAEAIREAATLEARSITVELLRLMKAQMEMQS